MAARRAPRARRPRPADGTSGPTAGGGERLSDGAGFNTRQVADVLGLPASRILAWARRGLISPRRGPGGAFVFSFRDVTVLRRVRQLLDADVPARRVHEALETIRETLPVGRPLSAVDLSVLGRRVLVREGASVWEPGTGQTELDFEAPPESGSASLPPAAQRGEQASADACYDAAVDLEAERPDEAMAAYREALDLDPGHVEANLNLGRLLHEVGRTAEAERHYRAALASDGSNARAWYNLGVALEDRGRGGDAKSAYERSVELEPELAAAHFNLSRLLEGEGRDAEALGHLVRYKRIVDQSAPLDPAR